MCASHVLTYSADEELRRVYVRCGCGVSLTLDAVDSWSFGELAAGLTWAMQDAHLDQDLRRLTA
jgi:hypothetical protein